MTLSSRLQHDPNHPMYKAALSLARAVQNENQDTRPNRSLKFWVGTVKNALQNTSKGSKPIKRLSKQRFMEVVDLSISLGLIEARRETPSALVYLVPKTEIPTVEPEPLPLDETAKPCGSDGRSPKTPPPTPLQCERCGARSAICDNCSTAAWDDDVFVDSKGEWKCSSCNDLDYKSSWGGLRRFLHESNGSDFRTHHLNIILHDSLISRERLHAFVEQCEHAPREE